MATFSDDFNRADGGLGSNWTNITTDVFAIVSNAVRGGTAGNTHYAHVATATADFSDDHYAQITTSAVTGNDSMGPAVRVNSSGCYTIRADTTSDATRRIVRVDGTTRTVIGTVTITVAANDVLKLTAEGSTIKAYKNGVLQDTATDTTYTTGQPGMFYLRGGTGAGRIDDFSAGEMAAGLSITSVTPSAFDDGRTGIVIAGSGFGASQGSSTLTIGGQAQTVTAWSDTSITFTSVRGSNSMGARSLTITRA